MAKHVRCPTCGNTKKKYQLSKCKCGCIYCIKAGNILSNATGCGNNGCPRCGEWGKGKRIGYINL